jgi:hypothetical protein
VRRDRNAEEGLNDDMILSIFHVNADITGSDFQNIAGWPIYRAVRCRPRTGGFAVENNKTFLIVPVRHLSSHQVIEGLI